MALEYRPVDIYVDPPYRLEQVYYVPEWPERDDLPHQEFETDTRRLISFNSALTSAQPQSYPQLKIVFAED